MGKIMRGTSDFFSRERLSPKRARNPGKALRTFLLAMLPMETSEMTSGATPVRGSKNSDPFLIGNELRIEIVPTHREQREATNSNR